MSGQRVQQGILKPPHTVRRLKIEVFFSSQHSFTPIFQLVVCFLRDIFVGTQLWRSTSHLENMRLCLYGHFSMALVVWRHWSCSDRAISVVYFPFMLEIILDLVMWCCICFVESIFRGLKYPHKIS